MILASKIQCKSPWEKKKQQISDNPEHVITQAGSTMRNEMRRNKTKWKICTLWNKKHGFCEIKRCSSPFAKHWMYAHRNAVFLKPPRVNRICHEEDDWFRVFWLLSRLPLSLQSWWTVYSRPIPYTVNHVHSGPDSAVSVPVLAYRSEKK